ncbi:GNAT family N-acetyltransferase [Candidatus Pacearchaeota archaeon]|nr:GNAT family N-acetyltransferase [Candidatus Pacearchaeota archaeon]
MLTKEITKPTVREMVPADIPFLKLEHEWLRDVYYDYFDQGRGPAWVLEDEDGRIACFGASILWPGVCEVWFSLIRTDMPIAVIRKAKRFLEEQGKRFGVKRFQCSVNVNNEISIKFVEFFGFKNETPKGMKFYLPNGDDAYLFSRTLNEN